jgi:hypothetical protein
MSSIRSTSIEKTALCGGRVREIIERLGNCLQRSGHDAGSQTPTQHLGLAHEIE